MATPNQITTFAPEYMGEPQSHPLDHQSHSQAPPLASHTSMNSSYIFLENQTQGAASQQQFGQFQPQLQTQTQTQSQTQSQPIQIFSNDITQHFAHTRSNYFDPNYEAQSQQLVIPQSNCRQSITPPYVQQTPTQLQQYPRYLTQQLLPQSLQNFSDGVSTLEIKSPYLNKVKKTLPSPQQQVENVTSTSESLQTPADSNSSTSRRSSFTKPKKPRIATTWWEDEKTICYQVEVHGVLVSRRQDTDYVNGTKLLNIAGMSRGKRDGVLKAEKKKYVVRVGTMKLKGVWIPFERAAEIARNEGVDTLLYPLFVRDIKGFFDAKGSKLKTWDPITSPPVQSD